MLDDEYGAFDEEMRSCRRCTDLFAPHPVNPPVDHEAVQPRPIVSGVRPKPVMLVGQAPGLTEYQTGKPFQGSAGQAIRRLFADAGVPQSRFDELVYSSAVIKCFPGSKLVRGSRGLRREDVVPTAAMVANCNSFLQRQIQMVDPCVLVTLGSFPLQQYLKLTGRRGNGAPLQDFVGTSEEWGKRTVVFLPHTSGTSRWQNNAENAARFDSAKRLLKAVLQERKVANFDTTATPGSTITPSISSRSTDSQRASHAHRAGAATTLSTERRAEILRAAMEAMRDAGGLWSRDRLRAAVLARITFTSKETALDTRNRPAWVMVLWELSPAKDRGWLASGGRDRWSITAAGIQALQDYPGGELVTELHSR